MMAQRRPGGKEAPETGRAPRRRLFWR